MEVVIRSQPEPHRTRSEVVDGFEGAAPRANPRAEEPGVGRIARGRPVK
jgi:hypothetical protein